MSVQYTVWDVHVRRPLLTVDWHTAVPCLCINDFADLANKSTESNTSPGPKEVANL